MIERKIDAKGMHKIYISIFFDVGKNHYFRFRIWTLSITIHYIFVYLFNGSHHTWHDTILPRA